MMTSHELADALGRKNIADAVGVGATAVSNAVVRGSFPASWYLAMAGLAAKAGTECPPALFGMRASNSSPVDPRLDAGAA